MLFLELALQNVAGFSPVARTALKPGYWVLRAPGSAPLASIALELFFSDGRGGDGAYLAPGQRTGRAGLLLQGNDAITYRITRELGGSGALHRLNTQTQTFEAVSADAGEITQYLRSQAGLPTRTSYQDLFTFSSAQLPSRRPQPARASKPGLPAVSLRASSPAQEANAYQAKLAELEHEVQLCRVVDQLQFRIDGLAGQLFELEGVAKSTEPLEMALREAQAAFAAAPTPELLRLPPDIVSRAERMEELDAKLNEDLAKLEADKVAAESAVEPTVAPLFADARFWTGLGVGVVALGVGAFTSGPLRYTALLDVPAFGFSAMVALKYVDDVQRSQQRSRKEDRLSERETKLRNAYSYESNPVKIAIQALGVETAKDVVDIFGRRGLLAARVNEVDAQLAQMRTEPTYAAAASRIAQLKAEQDRLNAELLDKGAYVRDLREVEREIAKAEASLAELRAPAAAPAQAPTAAPAQSREDPMPQVMKLASDIFSADILTLSGHFRDRAAQYLSALTERRWTALELDREGRAAAVGPSGRTPMGLLPARDLDFAYLALRLTVLEKFCARYKVPVLLEDPFEGMEESKLPLLGRMLKHLGTLTQVLHVTQHPGFVSAADGTVSV